MTESSPPPGIRASLNEAGELVLTAVNAPPEAVIRIDVNADSPRMLCTQGRYLAPVQGPARRAHPLPPVPGKARHYSPGNLHHARTSSRPGRTLHADSLHPGPGLHDLRLGVPA